jgi:glutamate N-acetyltransferase/amino-acid N-acetyltransferase
VSVTAAAGFRAAGVAAGLRAGAAPGSSQPPAPDVALVVNDGPLQAAAGVFTANRVKAAPVLWSQQVLAGGELRAVLLNAGGANACTGPEGFADTHRSAEHVAGLLGCGAAEVAVCSTGLIGERLPLAALLAGAADAHVRLSTGGGDAAADAIRTTDTRSKQARRTDESGVVVGGMAKGAGMLAPALATMLCVLTTDAIATGADLDAALRAAVAGSFDRLDTDGCMSTNDTVLFLASGASGVRLEPARLAAMTREVCDELADALLRDAEGASKWIRIDTVGAATETDALTVGRAVARSALFKCAVHGGDPNWGRVLAAVGTTDAAFDADRLGVMINGVQVCRDGAAAADRGTVDMRGPDVHVVIDLQAGPERATVATTDLTAAYVHENSAYSS